MVEERVGGGRRGGACQGLLQARLPLRSVLVEGTVLQPRVVPDFCAVQNNERGIYVVGYTYKACCAL